MQSLRTGIRGTADAYVEVALARVFYVQVGAESADTYGIPVGYEPVLNVDAASKSVDVVVGTPETYEVTVSDKSGEEKAGVKVKLQYAAGEAASGVVVSEGTTDASGKATFSFTRHAGSNYEIAVEASTVPAGYDVPAPLPVDFSAPATIELVLTKHVETNDHTVDPSSIRDLPEVQGAREFIPVNSPIVDTSSWVMDNETGFYYYGGDKGRVAYVGITAHIDRLFHGKSLIEVLNENPDAFSYEVCTDSQTNSWIRHDYASLIRTYADKVNDEGFYPLDANLYAFIRAAEQHDFFEATDSHSTLAKGSLPVYYYGEAVLGIGEDQQYTPNDANRLRAEKDSITLTPSKIDVWSKVPEGLYELTVTAVHGQGQAVTLRMPDYLFGYATGTKTGSARRNFVLDKIETASGSSLTTYKGRIYLPEYSSARQIWLFQNDASNGLDADGISLRTITLKAQDGVEGPIPIVQPDGEQHEVYVYPESYLQLQKNGIRGIENATTLFNQYAFDRTFATYTVTPVLEEELAGLKVHQIVVKHFYQNPGHNTYKDAVPMGDYADSNETLVHTIGGDVTASQSKEWQTQKDEYHGFVLTYSGDTIVKIKVTVTATYSQYHITYEAGEGEGEPYTSEAVPAGQESTILGVESSHLGFTKEGYVFDGWTYTDDEGEKQTLAAGATESFGHDVTLTAKWRIASAVAASGELGTEGNVSATLDTASYTAVRVALAEDVTAGEYVLTVHSDTQIRNLFLLIDGDVRVYLALRSSDDGYTYVGYLAINADTEDFDLIVESADLGSIAFTFTLAAYDAPDAGDGKVETPTNPYGEEKFKVQLADVSEGTYRVTVESAISVTPALKLVMASGEVDLGVDYLDKETYIEVKAGDTELWLVGGTDAENYYAALYITVTRVYSITFDQGEKPDPQWQYDFTGSTAPIVHKAEGEQVILPASGFSLQDCLFAGWKYTDGSGDHIYKRGASFPMPASDVTLYATWREDNPHSVTITTSAVEGVGIDIDPAKYTAYKIVYDINNETTHSYDGVYYFKMELGKTDYRKPIVFHDYNKNNNTSVLYDVVFTYSEALSTAENTVYTAIAMWNTGFATIKTLTIDLLNAYDGPVLQGTLYESKYSYTENVVQPAEAFAAESSINVGARPTNYMTGSNRSYFQVPKVAAGTPYKLHVRDYTGAGKRPSVVQYSAPSNASQTTNSNAYYLETLEGSGYVEYVYSVYFVYESWGLDVTGEAFYTYDVWLETVAGNLLQPDSTLDATLNPNEIYNVTLKDTDSTSYVFRIEVTGGVADTFKLTYNGSTIATLNAGNYYKLKNVSFSNLNIAVTSTAPAAVEVKFHLYAFEPTELEVSQTGVSLSVPANDELDLSFSAYSSSTKYKVTVTGADKELVLVMGTNTYNLNAENGYSADFVDLAKAGTIKVADGSAAELTMIVATYQSVNDNTAVSSLVWTPNEEKLFYFSSSTTLGEIAPFEFVLTVDGDVGDSLSFTLKYNGGQTAAFTRDPEANTFRTGLITLEEDNGHFSITANLDVTASLMASHTADIVLRSITYKENPATETTFAVSKDAGVKRGYFHATDTNTLMRMQVVVSAQDGSDKDYSDLTLAFSACGADGAGFTLSDPDSDGEGNYTFYALVKFTQADNFFTITTSEAPADYNMKISFRQAVVLKQGSNSLSYTVSSFANDGYELVIALEGMEPRDYYFTTGTVFNCQKTGSGHTHTTLSIDLRNEGSDAKTNFLANKSGKFTVTGKYLLLAFNGCTLGNGTYTRSFTLSVEEYYGLSVEKSLTKTVSGNDSFKIRLEDIDVTDVNNYNSAAFTLKAQVNGETGIVLKVKTGNDNIVHTLDASNNFTVSPILFVSKSFSVDVEGGEDVEVTFSIEEYAGEKFGTEKEYTVTLPAGGTVFLPFAEGIKGSGEYYTVSVSGADATYLVLRSTRLSRLSMLNEHTTTSAPFKPTTTALTVTSNAETPLTLTFKLEKWEPTEKLKADGTEYHTVMSGANNVPIPLADDVVWGGLYEFTFTYAHAEVKSKLMMTFKDDNGSTGTVSGPTKGVYTVGFTSTSFRFEERMVWVRLNTNTADEAYPVTVTLKEKYADGAKLLPLGGDGLTLNMTTGYTTLTTKNEITISDRSAMKGEYALYVISAEFAEGKTDLTFTNNTTEKNALYFGKLNADNSYRNIIVFTGSTHLIYVKGAEAVDGVTLKVEEFTGTVNGASRQATVDGASLTLTLKADELQYFAIEGFRCGDGVDYGTYEVSVSYPTETNPSLEICDSVVTPNNNTSGAFTGTTSDLEDTTTKTNSALKLKTNLIWIRSNVDVTVTITVKTPQA